MKDDEVYIPYAEGSLGQEGGTERKYWITPGGKQSGPSLLTLFGHALSEPGMQTYRAPA